MNDSDMIGKIFWSNFNSGKIFKNWENWYDNLLNKLNNKKYYDRLVSGIATAPVPDVWNDPLSSREFEDSCLESIIYSWSKKKSSNKIAQAMGRNLNLNVIDRNIIEKNQLRKKIEEWLEISQDKKIFIFSDNL
ncbi:Uncharacterized protein dnm_071070 [Desulfonema magnum]|uniref:Uncharacterized protein n=1 Tax=Desulfonema magnum TaxID=45655 RepID=A0A975BSV6_9BACT|nr:Uncharacterized protein dnm_071070 [Desulfonema magnum]